MSCDSTCINLRCRTQAELGQPSGTTVFVDPLSIPGLLVWLDAQDEPTIQRGGDDRVFQWNDKSGGGHHVTQTVADDKPLYRPVSAVDPTRPAVFFTGPENPWMSAPGGSWNQVEHVSLFLISDAGIKATNSFGAGTPYKDDGSWTTPWTAWQVGFIGLHGKYWVNSNGNHYNPTITSGASGGKYMWAMTFDGVDFKAWKNGSHVETTNAPGVITSSVDEVWAGEMQEVLAYDHALTTQEMTDLNNYLSVKWGIPI
jgi:hypothetical protein